MRTLIFSAALCLISCVAQAADARVDGAVKVFQSTAADPAKVKTFCEMSKVMDSSSEQADQATESKIQSYMTELGPDFEQAWNAGSDVDENSEDGKVYHAALEELASPLYS
jgi:hypothetical protein